MTFFFIISLVLFSNPDLLYGHYFNPEFLKEKAGKKSKTAHPAKRKGTGVKGAF